MSIPAEPPDIFAADPYPLLFHAKETALEPMVDTPENRRRGWQRIVLFAFYFRPDALGDVDWRAMVRDAFQSPDRSRRAYFGLFPFRWRSNWQDSFETLRGEGELFVAPVLQRLIFNRAPQQVLNWVDRVAQWPFERIIAAHLDAPVAAQPAALRRVFGFLRQSQERREGVLPEQELALINQIDQRLRGVMPPPQGKLD